ncbi:hypothetical protein D9758_017655 [Tetrapyrgos nigripes]|uniref:NAD(P)-binding protein n=1 Tax=Tetrapyrgos nigripes TaxID=182062 RepID=A0A8H5CFI1_9AGAR|nr:hypothetical protein D9758_017655 [Tetrapyrgos nigripes]
MGSTLSIISEAYPPKPQWTTDDIPDLTGKVMIVTGGNTGIGKETVKALLEKNAKVYLGACNQAKAEAAIEDLRQKTGKEAMWVKLDLADLKSVKAAAEEFSSKEERLDVLFNNAGVMGPKFEDLTAQGYDLQFGTNVLETPARKKIGSFPGLYNQSKFGNVLFSNELAKRYGDQGIVSVSLNPGNLASDLPRSLPPIMAFIFKILFMYPVELGALTQLRAGTTPQGAEMNGQYLIPWARVGKASAASENQEESDELWKWLEEQAKGV